MSVLNNQQTRGSIFKVNMMLIGSVIQGVAAYWFWPTSKEWWMLYIYSVLIGCAAIATFIQALRLIWQIYLHDNIFGEYRKKGGEQKSSRMASDEALKKTGMLDD